jgi:hypothetical protein
MAWHSLVIVLLPLLLSLVVMVRCRSALAGNWLLFYLAVALSFVQGRPEIQDLYAQIGRSEEYLFAHAVPFFVILYLIFGRFEMPSVWIAWAGTFLCLLVTDASFTYFQWRLGPYDIQTLLGAIGGAGWEDGLLITSLGAGTITAFAHWQIKRGHEFVSMIGRRRYLRARQEAARTSL